ncbi:MAG: tRNA (guanosine(37)-N1)-methyltransferase TrmD [Patescibacteria group bacterium]
MKFDIITIFPKIFDSYLNESIIKRARKKGLVEIAVHNLRDFTEDKHRKVDDRPFGGGPGMVMQIQPIIKAVEFVKSKIPPQRGEARSMKLSGKNQKSKIILFTPAGKQFNNKTAVQLAKNYDNLILIAGRYEGIDARTEKVIKNLIRQPAEKISIGPYVLTGGELPAMVLIDAVSRQITGVLGKNESLEENRFGVGMQVYTRPEVFKWKGKKYKVPKILLSGNHKKIAAWRTIKVRRRASP